VSVAPGVFKNGEPLNTVETSGFAKEFVKYLERPDEQIRRDYRTFVDDQHVYHELLREAVDRCPRRVVEMLEIGTGSGCTTTLVSTWPATRVVASDILMEALACTRRTLALCGGRADKIFYLRADGTRLPYRDGSIDVVYHQGLLEHFHDTAPFMRELKRVLRPDGSLVINVPQTYSWYTVKKWLAMKRGEWGPGWETQFSSGDLKRLANQHGLDLVTIRGQTYDSKWNELAKGYRKLFRPWLPSSLDQVFSARWNRVIDHHGHRFLVEIIGVFLKH